VDQPGSSPLIETLTRDEVTRLINTAYGDALEAAYVLAVTLGMRQANYGDSGGAPSSCKSAAWWCEAARRTLDNQQVISLPKTRAGHRSLRSPSMH
jgi:hypothetical protein